MDTEFVRRSKISQSLIGNTRRLGISDSEETKKKKSLALKGRIPWNKGKPWSDEAKLKMSIHRKGKVFPWMRRQPTDETVEKLKKASTVAWHNPAIRKKYHDALQRTKWIRVRTDIGQIELLDKWNRLGFSFQPNYQIRTSDGLFYIDGYDSINNIVLEYDGKYHRKLGQKEKDEMRQQKIIQTLKPKRFWRYDAVEKTVQNVLG